MTFSLAKDAIISICIQGLLQGGAIVVFVLMVFMLTRGGRHRRLNRGMLAASTALLLLSMTEFISDIFRLVRGLITIGPNHPDGVEGFFASLAEPTLLIKGILHPFQILILDGVVVYRAYVAWQSYCVLAFLGIGWISSFVSTIGLIYVFFTAYATHQSVYAFRTGSWISAVLITTLATNIPATFFLAYRLWIVNRRVESLGSSPKLRVVYQVVIESATIYTAFSITTLILFIMEHPMTYVIRDFIPPIISIVFNMIVVRVGLVTSPKLTVLGLEGSETVTTAIRFRGSQGAALSSAEVSISTSPTCSDAKQEQPIAIGLAELMELDNLSSKDDNGSILKVVGGDASNVSIHVV